MLERFSNAFGIFFSNFRLLGSIVLIVQLPGILLSYAPFLGSDAASHQARRAYYLIAFVAALFLGALSSCAVIYAVWKILRGEGVTIGEALRDGVRVWPKLVLARIVAGVLVALGLIAFIIPGVVLAIRWALIDCVVVMEFADSPTALRRSAGLTRGNRWKISGTWLLWVVCVGFVLMVVYAPVAFAKSILFAIAGDVIIAFAGAILTIIFFLYYAEAVGHEEEKERGHDERSALQ